MKKLIPILFFLLALILPAGGAGIPTKIDNLVIGTNANGNGNPITNLSGVSSTTFTLNGVAITVWPTGGGGGSGGAPAISGTNAVVVTNMSGTNVTGYTVSVSPSVLTNSQATLATIVAGLLQTNTGNSTGFMVTTNGGFISTKADGTVVKDGTNGVLSILKGSAPGIGMVLSNASLTLTSNANIENNLVVGMQAQFDAGSISTGTGGDGELTVNGVMTARVGIISVFQAFESNSTFGGFTTFSNSASIGSNLTVAATNASGYFVGNGGGLTNVPSSSIAQPFTNGLIQTNNGTTAYFQVTTNAHLHSTDENGTTFDVHTNAAIAVVKANGVGTVISNGSITTSSNITATSGVFTGNGAGLTNWGGGLFTNLAYGSLLPSYAFFTNFIYLSPSGNNANNGLTPATAVASLDRASVVASNASLASPALMVCILASAGTYYTTNAFLTTNVSLMSPFTNSQAIFQCSIQQDGTLLPTVIISGDNVSVINCVINDAQQLYDAGVSGNDADILITGGTNITIAYNHFLAGSQSIIADNVISDLNNTFSFQSSPVTNNIGSVRILNNYFDQYAYGIIIGKPDFTAINGSPVVTVSYNQFQGDNGNSNWWVGQYDFSGVLIASGTVNSFGNQFDYRVPIQNVYNANTYIVNGGILNLTPITESYNLSTPWANSYTSRFPAYGSTIALQSSGTLNINGYVNTNLIVTQGGTLNYSINPTNWLSPPFFGWWQFNTNSQTNKAELVGTSNGYYQIDPITVFMTNTTNLGYEKFTGTNGPIGNASGLTNLQASQLVGTATNTVATATNFSGSLSGNVTGTQSATVVSSVGSASLPGAQITGTAPYAALAALLSGTNTWTGTNTFTNTVIATNAQSTSQFAGTFTGNASGITNDVKVTGTNMMGVPTNIFAGGWTNVSGTTGSTNFATGTYTNVFSSNGTISFVGAANTNTMGANGFTNATATITNVYGTATGTFSNISATASNTYGPNGQSNVFAGSTRFSISVNGPQTLAQNITSTSAAMVSGDFAASSGSATLKDSGISLTSAVFSNATVTANFTNNALLLYSNVQVTANSATTIYWTNLPARQCVAIPLIVMTNSATSPALALISESNASTGVIVTNPPIYAETFATIALSTNGANIDMGSNDTLIFTLTGCQTNIQIGLKYH